jgi:hypothetical protein
LLKISSGQYVAEFVFAENSGCAAGDARLQVGTVGKFGRVLSDYSGPMTPGRLVDLPFQLKLMDAALGAVEFRVVGLDGCALLQRVGWTPPITAH